MIDTLYSTVQCAKDRFLHKARVYYSPPVVICKFSLSLSVRPRDLTTWLKNREKDAVAIMSLSISFMRRYNEMMSRNSPSTDENE